MRQFSHKEYDQMLYELYSHTVPLIKPEEIDKLRNPLILDIRSEKEHVISHIPGAIFYDYKNFKVDQLDPSMKENQLVLYCTVGYRSEKVGEKLIKAGFNYVYNIWGGIFQWVNEGFSVANIRGDQINRVHAYNKKWSQWLLKGEKVYE